MNKRISTEAVSIGFIGQGWVGRHIADDFVSRGFQVVRYSREAPYNSQENKKKISECEVVFVAVPTPTTKKGFSDKIVREVLSIVGKGKIAVIKSSILPGMTDAIQKDFPDICIFHAPEFLTEANAAHDAAHPSRNIIGIPDIADLDKKKIYKKKADFLSSLMPKSPRSFIMSAKEAELVKYLSNCFLALKVIYSNIGFDLAEALSCDYSIIAEALGADERIGGAHLKVKSGNGRGAGGHCFIKDLAAFCALLEKTLGKSYATDFFRAAENKNIELLATTGKDSELLKGVYGEKKIEKICKKNFRLVYTYGKST
ncbi:MAG: hypothetical protein PHS53_00075 [Candidatus Pacebacteria bacterium]|nr:hypothetical protein [Candidatus Paceibacterota bacterium]